MSRGVTRPGHEVTLCTPTVKTWAVCSVDSQDMPGQWPLISVITGDNVGGSQLCSTHPSSGVGGYRERVGQDPGHAHNNAGYFHTSCVDCVVLVSELLLTGVGFHPFTLHILECKTVLAEAIRRADEFIEYI